MKKLGFGMMRLPLPDPKEQGTVDMEQVCKMVDTFLERGYTYFDTAYMYHAGQSEITAREALVKRHSRDSFTLATKMGRGNTDPNAAGGNTDPNADGGGNPDSAGRGNTDPNANPIL